MSVAGTAPASCFRKRRRTAWISTGSSFSRGDRVATTRPCSAVSRDCSAGPSSAGMSCPPDLAFAVEVAIFRAPGVQQRIFVDDEMRVGDQRVVVGRRQHRRERLLEAAAQNLADRLRARAVPVGLQRRRRDRPERVGAAVGQRGESDGSAFFTLASHFASERSSPTPESANRSGPAKPVTTCASASSCRLGFQIAGGITAIALATKAGANPAASNTFPS